jgi:hypothetical protein
MDSSRLVPVMQTLQQKKEQKRKDLKKVNTDKTKVKDNTNSFHEDSHAFTSEMFG